MVFVMKYCVCLVLTWISLGETIFIVGPDTIRPNRDFTVSIYNPFDETGNGTVRLRIEGKGLDGSTLLNLSKIVNVQPGVNEMANFKIPSNITKGDYRIVIEGKRVFNGLQEKTLKFRSSSLMGLIQLNKPVYKPGDKLKFRVIVIDDNLKPVIANETTVSVYVKDPNGDVLRRWSNVILFSGIFEDKVAIPSTMRGVYSIFVEANGNDLVSKIFYVRVYTLPAIDLNVYTTVVPLLEHQALNLTVEFKNNLGKPISGTVNVDVFLKGNRETNTSGSWNVTGFRAVHLPFVDKLDFYGEEEDVVLRFGVTTHLANYGPMFYSRNITVYKYKYNVRLDQMAATYRPGSPFTGTLNVAYRNNEPAKNATLLVRVEGKNETHERNYTSNMDGDIIFSFETSISSELDTLIVYEHDHKILREKISKFDSNIAPKFELQRLTRVKFNRMLKLMAKCSHGMDILLYYIVAKGNIVNFGSFKPNQMTRYPFQVLISDKLIPRSKILAVAVVNANVLINVLDVAIEDFGNPVEIKIEENIGEDGVDPGDEIELSIRGRPGAFVALTAYDYRLRAYINHHDIFVNEVWEKFDAFYVTQTSEYASENIGVFHNFFEIAKYNNIPIAENEYASRGILPDAPRFGMPEPYRADLWDSWLFQNVTIPPSGRFQLVTTIPHTVTSWHITGFSIDPEYGLGIVKKSIPFKAIKIFYIADQLLDAIRRGMTVPLYFNLISNLEEEFVATVMMFNVANQIRFVDFPPEEATATKYVSVPPNSVVPVVFRIEALKMGEVEIRVNTSIMQGAISDSFRKIITVFPESVIFNGTKRALITCNSTPYEIEKLFSAIYETAVEESVTGSYYPLTPDQNVWLTSLNKTLQDVDLTDFPYYDMNSLNVRSNETNVLITVQDEANIANNYSDCSMGVLQLSWQYLMIYQYDEKSRFELNVTKQATPSILLWQVEICCSFIPEREVYHSNGTVVEVSIPIGYAMDNHSVDAITNTNPINRTEVLHGGSTLRVHYNSIGVERNCFIVFAYRRYTMPIRCPVFILVKDHYHPEFGAFKEYDFY